MRLWLSVDLFTIEIDTGKASLDASGGCLKETGFFFNRPRLIFAIPFGQR
jgi:hypothetical protein